jgi:hypothetical protein
VSNIAHIPQFTLCELWFRSYTMLLELRTFRVQYSSERICAAIGGISTIEWALNSKHAAKYSAHPPVYAMWTVVPDIYNVITAPHIQTSIFNWTYLRCYCRYLDNATRDILQTWSQMQRTSSNLRYVNCGPEIYSAITVPHMQASIFNSMYLCCYWRYLDNSMRITLQTWCQIQRRSSNLRYVNCDPEVYNAITVPHMQASIFNWTYLRCYWRYLDNSMCVILQTWCHIQRTSSSLRCVNCGTAIYKVLTAPHIYASIFDGTYLRCNWS